ncbi:MAG TPA: mercury transporter [Pseudonocardiaceae bacterium]|nr:mercury transporter [Pseudonocardiaceae bacterium]
MTDQDNRPGVGGTLAVVGGGLLMVLCCAGPVLLAGSTLTAVGGALRSPWLLGAGAVVVLAALGYTFRRRVRRPTSAGSEDCCPPSSVRSDPADQKGQHHS